MNDHRQVIAAMLAQAGQGSTAPDMARANSGNMTTAGQGGMGSMAPSGPDAMNPEIANYLRMMQQGQGIYSQMPQGQQMPGGMYDQLPQGIPQPIR